MLLYNRILKRKKYHKHKVGRLELRRSSAQLIFGDFGLRSLENGYITPNQIEAMRRVFVAQTRRKGRFWIRLLSDIVRTKKSTGARMGSGKGGVDHWVGGVKAGRILMEFVMPVFVDPRRVAAVASSKTSLRLELVVKDGWCRNASL
jgi:large subunit ribosomal protein L16